MTGANISASNLYTSPLIRSWRLVCGGRPTTLRSGTSGWWRPSRTLARIGGSRLVHPRCTAAVKLRVLCDISKLRCRGELSERCYALDRDEYIQPTKKTNVGREARQILRNWRLLTPANIPLCHVPVPKSLPHCPFLLTICIRLVMQGQSLALFARYNALMSQPRPPSCFRLYFHPGSESCKSLPLQTSGYLPRLAPLQCPPFLVEHTKRTQA